MEEFNYLKEKKRYLNSIGRIGEECDGVSCENCMFSQENNGTRSCGCHSFEMIFPNKATEIVKKWAAEHPVKTRKDVLLKKFPNAKFMAGKPEGTPKVCAHHLGLVPREGLEEYCENTDCSDCWNEQYEE